MTLKTALNVEDSMEFKEFCEIRGLAPGSIRLYKIAFNKYVSFTGLSLEELIDEAEMEEDLGTRMRKRKIKQYLTTFKMNLKKQGLSNNTINHTMALIKSYYKENDIMLPDEPRRKTRSDKKQPTIYDLPTMEEIQKFLEYANPTYRAIATVMLSSGMSRAETISLTFNHLFKAIPLPKPPKNMEELIDTLESMKDRILFWQIIRIKTGHHYFTFTSPEATVNIVNYLKDLHYHHPEYNPNLEDTLFRNNNVPITPNAVSEMFRRINQRAGLRKVCERILVRPHSLRKYFATTLEKARMPHLTTRWLMGHDLDDTTSSYFFADPETLRADYIEVLDQIQTNKVQTVIVNQLEDVVHEIDSLKNEVVTLKKEIRPFKG